MPVLSLACVSLVAALNHVPGRALLAIASVEGGQRGQASRNLDGSEDLGPMQVNTRWLPAIAQAMHASVQTARERLLDDTCFNVSAGGAILRTYLQQTGGDLMLAIGDYHSHTPALNHHYQQLVVSVARRMYAAPAPPVVPRDTVTSMRSISFSPVP